MTGSATDVIRTFGTVFEDVSCEQVATKTLRAAFTWGGVAALGILELAKDQVLRGTEG
jgi:hypothetical protein